MVTSSRGGVTLGFSGDASISPNLDLLIEQSQVVFIDSNTLAPDPGKFHLGVAGALTYAAKHPDKKFFLVHRGDYELPELPANVFAPEDGDEVVV